MAACEAVLRHCSYPALFGFFNNWLDHQILTYILQTVYWYLLVGSSLLCAVGSNISLHTAAITYILLHYIFSSSTLPDIYCNIGLAAPNKDVIITSNPIKPASPLLLRPARHETALRVRIANKWSEWSFVTALLRGGGPGLAFIYYGALFVSKWISLSLEFYIKLHIALYEWLIVSPNGFI